MFAIDLTLPAPEGLRPLPARPLYQAPSTSAAAYHPWALARARSLFDLDRLDEALAAARWGRAAAVEAGAWSALAEFQVVVGAALDARGDVDAAVIECGAAIELAEVPGPGWEVAAAGALASIAIRRDHLDEAAALLADVWSPDAPHAALVGRAKAELLEAHGRLAEALGVLTDVHHVLLDPD